MLVMMLDKKDESHITDVNLPSWRLFVLNDGLLEGEDVVARELARRHHPVISLLICLCHDTLTNMS